jgi:flagellar basal-body rod modification protein FlgD
MTSLISSTAAASAAQPTTSANPAAGAAASTVDYQSFLKLLIAQLKNQDPTKPMDSTQFVSQLASFSAVEQQISTNARLDQMLTQSSIAQAGAMVGLHLRSADGSIEGNITQVNILSTGVVAVLDNGQSVPVGAGISLSPAV